METPPDSHGLLPRPGQLIRPQKIDLCVATRGTGSDARPAETDQPCVPPQIGAQRGAAKGYDEAVSRSEFEEFQEEAVGGYEDADNRDRIRSSDFEETRRYDMEVNTIEDEVTTDDDEVLLRLPPTLTPRPSLVNR